MSALASSLSAGLSLDVLAGLPPDLSPDAPAALSAGPGLSPVVGPAAGRGFAGRAGGAAWATAPSEQITAARVETVRIGTRVAQVVVRRCDLLRRAREVGGDRGVIASRRKVAMPSKVVIEV